MMFCGMTNALLLIAMAFGYTVFCSANKEKKALRNLGLFIGIFAMAMSAILILSNLAGGKHCDKKMMMKHRQMMSAPPLEE